MCEHCGGQVKVIARIEDPVVISHILKHLKQTAAAAATDTTRRDTLLNAGGIAFDPECNCSQAGQAQGQNA